jgi:carbon storage regulator
VLVIRRRPGETVMIGEDVEIEILDATHSQVKLGIRAPKSVTVLRKEIRITREQNLAAAHEISSLELDRLKSALSGPVNEH